MSNKSFSVISEKEEPWIEKKEEMERIKGMLDEGCLTVLEEPSQTEVGSFRARISPKCSMEIPGCFVELEMQY